MIHSLKGILTVRKPTFVVLDVHGIGYEVNIPLSTYEQLPPLNAECFLWIYHQIREGGEALFGFMTVEERDFFQLLISVSGIGPRLAIGMMSGTSVEDFRQRIISGDIKALTSLPGIGNKTARRIIVELKEKFVDSSSDVSMDSIATTPLSNMEQDAFLALVSLGYRKQEARKALEKVKVKHDHPADIETLIKLALKEMES